MSTSSWAWFAVGDVLAIVVFTVIGLKSHEEGVTVPGVLEVVAPIVVAGALAALAFGTYRAPGFKTLLPTWAIAIPAGILIRKAIFGEPETWRSFGIFAIVALTFSLLFLSVWRLIARYVIHLDR